MDLINNQKSTTIPNLLTNLNKKNRFRISKSMDKDYSKTIKLNNIQKNIRNNNQFEKTIKKCWRQLKPIEYQIGKLFRKTVKKKQIQKKGNIYKGQFQWKAGNYLSQNQNGQVLKAIRLEKGDFMIVKKIIKCSHSNQITILKKLQGHKGIIKFYGYDYDDKFNYIYLQYMSHRSLRSVLNEFGPLSSKIFRIYLKQILQILVYINSKGYLHCDLKASNFLINEQGSIKLCDFGNSVPIQFASNSKLGSALWASPQVLKGQNPNISSQIWSIGCLAIQLLTGKLPWSQYQFGSPLCAIYSIGSWQKEPILENNSQDWQFVRLCLKINPQDRPTCQQLLKWKQFTC